MTFFGNLIKSIILLLEASPQSFGLQNIHRASGAKHSPWELCQRGPLGKNDVSTQIGIFAKFWWPFACLNRVQIYRIWKMFFPCEEEDTGFKINWFLKNNIHIFICSQSSFDAKIWSKFEEIFFKKWHFLEISFYQFFSFWRPLLRVLGFKIHRGLPKGAPNWGYNLRSDS